MEMQGNNKKIPESKKTENSLDSLSANFTPDDVKFMVGLNYKFSVEECNKNAENTISRFKAFSDNGDSSEGLGFNYTDLNI